MPDNLRKYTSQTKYRLVLWFIVLLFTLGLGLIWIFYGRNSALLGFFCLLAMAVPIGLVALFLLLLDRIAKKNNNN